MNKILFCTFVAVVFCFANDYTRHVENITVQTTVKEGDTLWWLVGDEMEKVGDCRDVREVIHKTIELNNLRGKSLEVGDVIVIPLEVKK